ncbi:CRE-CLEC-50 protein [Aphelenchoides avenae]|nr:CRE-CLEC-50 protein [Aphelenchus avenae]
MMFFSAFLLILLVEGARAVCPAGSIRSPDDQKCYTIHPNASNWMHAEEICKKESGCLASIPNAFTNGFLFGVLKGGNYSSATHYWVGGNHIAGIWQWNDGSKWSYTNWASGEPREGSDCLSFHASTSQWRSMHCKVPRPYICQVPNDADQNADGKPTAALDAGQ